MQQEKISTPEGLEGTKTISGGTVLGSDSGSPPEQLTVEDISAITGLSPRYVQDLQRVGYLNPIHYTNTQEPVGSPEKAKEAAQARVEGKAIFLEARKVSAQEMFGRFWNLPRGKKRLMDPRTHREVTNLSKGYPVDHRSDVMVIQGAADPYGGRLSQEETLKMRGKIMVDPNELERIITKGIDAKLQEGWISPSEAAILREQAARGRSENAKGKKGKKR